jgi:hypothetical protein
MVFSGNAGWDVGEEAEKGMVFSLDQKSKSELGVAGNGDGNGDDEIEFMCGNWVICEGAVWGGIMGFLVVIL